MRRDLDALIDEARRAEGPAAGDMASAREALAGRISRGEHVELEAETPEVAPSGGVRAPGVPRAAWAVLGAAAVAAALLVSRATPPVRGPMADVQRAETELPQTVSRPPTPAEPAQQEPSAEVPAPDGTFQPLPEPPSGEPPSHTAREHAPKSSTTPPRAAPSTPARPKPEAGDSAASQLAAESRALAEVQRALRDGQFGRALQLLTEHDRQFARGVLLEERAAARAIASCGAGVGEAARESARAFASRYQHSPLRARVRASCKDLASELPEHRP